MLFTKESFMEKYTERFMTKLSKNVEDGTLVDKYVVLASVLRDALSKSWVKTNNYYLNNLERQVYYFSLEFLTGKFLELNLLGLECEEVVKEGLHEMGIELEELIGCEPDAGLGNGGLGRLAACFLDSLAALGFPGHGTGIRYKYGLFKQKIVDGYQVELPDNWLRQSNPWEICKPDKSTVVKLYGTIRTEETPNGYKYIHENYLPVIAVPYDMPIVGADNNTVNTLRLWSAEVMPGQELDFASFSKGDYVRAVSDKYAIESISEVLYPDDSNYTNRLLRLKQQYFFVSAGLQSIVRRFNLKHCNTCRLDKLVAVHINDTHPALAVPELMRILMDEEGYGWDEAWEITTSTIAYTNHTILPEALETWPIELVKELLPRIYMIIEEIDRRFVSQAREDYEEDIVSRVAILWDGVVRMANLAVVGSFSVNGVAQVHSELLKNVVMKDLYKLFPEKFNNKTNGITHRRWLIKANPDLAELICDTIGTKWKKCPTALEELAKHKDDTALHDKLHEIKRLDKERLAKYILEANNIKIDPDSIFDVQVKRIHAYKRQLLNALHIQHLYNRILNEPGYNFEPRTFIFAGKAAPSYHFAKSVIKYINELAAVINGDPRVKDRLKIVFLENYNVGLAELIFPASNISEQISTASKEASGTGNMKFMMNGAITIGTDDGANIEIRKYVGDSNFILFGLNVQEVINYYENGGYYSRDYYYNNPDIKLVIDQITNCMIFKHAPMEDFRSIVRTLIDYNDEYFVLKDFESYANAHSRADALYKAKDIWGSMSIVNMAMSAHFSSDNTIEQYASDIWNLQKCVIE